MLSIDAILNACRTRRAETAARRCVACGNDRPCGCAGRDAVRELCRFHTDTMLRLEIELMIQFYETAISAGLPDMARRGTTARAALETERDRRSHEAAIATLPEDQR
jgi:hypothetical protein